jgi:two-component system LytT family response regulator
MIRAIIVDDEPNCCEVLNELLDRHCPGVQVMDICHNGYSAISAIGEGRPDLVFLDIEMPEMNGFQLLERLGKMPFQLIFTTSYDQYAIKAIRHSALDYLLKPIDREELKEAVSKVASKLRLPLPEQLGLLLEWMGKPANALNKLAIPTLEGLQMVPVESIISCASDSNYSILNLKTSQRLVVCRTLKEFEELLEDHSFLRVHHSHLVNLKEVTKYVKGEGGYVLMSDGTTIDVSRSRKEVLLSRLNGRPGGAGRDL